MPASRTSLGRNAGADDADGSSIHLGGRAAFAGRRSRGRTTVGQGRPVRHDSAGRFRVVTMNRDLKTSQRSLALQWQLRLVGLSALLLLAALLSEPDAHGQDQGRSTYVPGSSTPDSHPT